MWNLCKEVNGNFDLPNLEKYKLILNTKFLWQESLNCIVGLARTYASFIVTPPRHVEAPGHEGGIWNPGSCLLGLHIRNRGHKVEHLPRTDTAVIGINWESTYCLWGVTVRWDLSLCVLTGNESLVWNASPNPSISPHPATTPDSDVVLSGELVLCSLYLFLCKWDWKVQVQNFVNTNTCALKI